MTINIDTFPLRLPVSLKAAHYFTAVSPIRPSGATIVASGANASGKDLSPRSEPP
jgi:hypothetical protein